MSSATASSLLEGVGFEELALYPEAACLMAARALKNGERGLPDRLVRALGPILLPGAQNPWEGAAGEFWREAFKLDPKPWLESILSSLEKDQVKESARALLIASAQHGAFECFDYLLSLGAARRSWKILESAYLNGGWRAAEKVKKPTAKEAALLMSYGSEGYRHRDCQHTGEGLRWLAGFLDPAQERSLDWLRSVAMTQSSQTALFCVQHHEELKIGIKKSDALALACSLAASPATEATLALIEKYQLNVKSTIAGQTPIYVPTPSPYQKFVEIRVSNLTLVQAALMGLNARCAKELMILGAPLPSKERLAAGWRESGHSGWLAKMAEKAAPASESARETVELEATLLTPEPLVKRQPRGL